MQLCICSSLSYIAALSMLLHLGMYLLVLKGMRKKMVVFGEKSIRFTYSGGT